MTKAKATSKAKATTQTECKTPNGVRFGYARVSSKDQDCAVQVAALEAAGCKVIRQEKRSGTKLEGRDELETVLAILRPGDTIVVTRLDRLARSVFDLQTIIKRIENVGKDDPNYAEYGAFLLVTQQNIDLSTPHGKAFANMIGTFAQFETDLRKERQMEGIRAAQAAGAYKGGRKQTIDAEKVRTLHAGGMKPAKIARELGIGRASVYRHLGTQEG